MITRWMSGIWGVVSFAIMAVLVVVVLVLLELPLPVIWAGVFFVGALLILRVIAVVRGSNAPPQEFSAFESNALGEPVNQEFQAPYHRELPFDSAESVLAGCAPIMQVMSSLGDFFKSGSKGILGKGKTGDAENALVLTQKRLLLLMIGPDDLRRFSPDSRVTRLLESLPGDAAAKRRMLWQTGAREVGDALSRLLAETSLEHMAQTHYSFTIPLSDITAVGHSPQKRTLTLQLGGQRLQYCLKNQEELACLVRRMAGLGLSSA
ncbi:MAG: hypothetical protein K9L19_14310 [Desulfarculaceae bacterium]|nr:hypothetical protein [Desulfarculaceae bacterium]